MSSSYVQSSRASEIVRFTRSTRPLDCGCLKKNSRDGVDMATKISKSSRVSEGELVEGDDVPTQLARPRKHLGRPRM